VIREIEIWRVAMLMVNRYADGAGANRTVAKLIWGNASEAAVYRGSGRLLSREQAWSGPRVARDAPDALEAEAWRRTLPVVD
jgi:hypothetical protein